MNITGLTDKVASDVAVAGGKSGAAQLTPQIVAANLPTITRSIGDIRTQFSDVIAKAGIVVATFDPLGVPFLTNHTGYDNVLDNTVVTINASGATVLAVTSNYTAPGAAPLQGNWDYSYTLNGVLGPSGVGSATSVVVPASRVPTSLPVNTGTSTAPEVTVRGGITYTRTCVLTGLYKTDCSVTAVGLNTNYTTTDSRHYISYSGCGTCGVGSKVVVVMEGVFSELGGTDGGVVVIPTSQANLDVMTYVRIN
jgi:hypothetical protein